MLKTKRAKAVKVVGKQKTAKVVLDKIQSILSRAGVRDAIQPRSRTYCAIGYFLKHRPVVNKLYRASEILKGNESSLPFIGSTTRKNLLKVFKGFKSIKAEGTKTGNKNLFVAFKFVK